VDLSLDQDTAARLNALEARLAALETDASTRLVEAVHAQPALALFAGGLQHFAEIFEEAYLHQHPILLARWQARHTVRSVARQYAAFIAWCHDTLENLHEALSTEEPSEATRSIWESYVVPIHGKMEECGASLAELAEKLSGDADGATTVPPFEQFMQIWLADPATLERVAAAPQESFQRVLDDYARHAAQQSAQRMQAALADEAAAAAETERTRSALLHWLAADLLRLSDYLDEMRDHVRACDGGPGACGARERSSGAVDAYPGPHQNTLNAELRRRLEVVYAEFAAFLGRLGVARIVIEPNRAQMEPALHQIVQRNGDGQTIVKEVAPGFTYGGDTLRKSEVWVA
jgi:hypothetical protein